MLELEIKLKEFKSAKPLGYEKALSVLEEAHLIAQPKAWPHFYVHWQMFLLAYKYRNWNEFLGQIPRLFFAVPGSLFGRAPQGNVGSTKMGIFEVKK